MKIELEILFYNILKKKEKNIRKLQIDFFVLYVYSLPL